MLVWSENPKELYLNQNEIHEIKHTMAVDAGFGYAEYEDGKLLKDKAPDKAMEYLERTS